MSSFRITSLIMLKLQLRLLVKGNSLMRYFYEEAIISVHGQLQDMYYVEMEDKFLCGFTNNTVTKILLDNKENGST